MDGYFPHRIERHLWDKDSHENAMKMQTNLWVITTFCNIRKIIIYHRNSVSHTNPFRKSLASLITYADIDFTTIKRYRDVVTAAEREQWKLFPSALDFSILHLSKSLSIFSLHHPVMRGISLARQGTRSHTHIPTPTTHINCGDLLTICLQFTYEPLWVFRFDC